jgi:eukaryotic-like serine/threonine-protein kinase
MKESRSFSDSPRSTDSPGEPREQCEQCGSKTRLNNGLCVNCLLGEGLESDTQSSSEDFERVLGEAEVPDKNWRMGNYEILEEIARGGMGVIYKARQRHSRRIVALKRVLSYQVGSRDALMRFQREAQAAANLDHPNILPIYEVGESEDGLPFFSMKYVTGGSLQQVGSSVRSDPRRCVRLMEKITRAVEYAHGRGILHRDIKPGNILIDERGEPLVSDFGLAKSLGANSDLTRTLTAFGTPGYIAPEQARSAAADLTAAADIYSLGAVLFFLLTGRTPFVGENALVVLRQAADTPAPKLRSLNSSLDRDLETICARCLEQDPKARYQSAGQLADDLQRWLENRPIVARPVAIPERAWRWSRRNPKLLVATMLGILVGAAAIWLFRENLFRATPAGPPENSIAVLPFVDLSPAKDQEYFCDGISEEILHALARVDGLRVLGRTSSFSFKGTNTTPSEIGKKLNVEEVLEGSVRRDGNQVRVTAELINTRTGFQIWTETYDRQLPGVFALQDEITRSIVNALKIKLAAALPVHEQRDPEVYDLYLQGLYFSNKASEDDLRRGLSFFQRALDKDPKFATAWTGVAKVWYFLAGVYVKPLDAFPKAKEAALKAIALDEKDAEAHCYLSETKRVLDWDLVGADAELQRALQLDPNSAPAHFFSALLPLFRGDPQEGLRLILEAKRLDPLSPITSYVVTAAYLANDRTAEAIDEGQRTLQLDPNYFYLDSNLAAAYRESGDFPKAIELYTQAQSVRHLPSTGLAITYVQMKQRAKAREIVDQLIQESQKRYIPAPSIAAIYVALRDKDEAFNWLERAFAEHSGILQWIAFLPEFRPLRSDARFSALLQRAGVSFDPQLAITETTLSKIDDSNAQEHFVLKVGVKPRPKTENGHVVRITVSFYDLTGDNKFVPTNAQVGYNWLSPTRDWTEPTPKFIAASYLRPKNDVSPSENRRYGGYIVQVFFDGKLQDCRATSSELLKFFSPDKHIVPQPSAPQQPR